MLAQRDVAAPLTIGVRGAAPVLVVGVDQPARGHPQILGGEQPRLLGQIRLDLHVAFGLHVQRQRRHRLRDDPRRLARDRPLGDRSRDVLEDRRQRLTGQPAPRTQLPRRRHPRLGLARVHPHQQRQQRHSVPAPPLTGQPTPIDLGDQSVIEHRRRAPLHLQLPHQPQQLVAGQAPQIQRPQRSPRRPHQTHRLLRRRPGHDHRHEVIV